VSEVVAHPADQEHRLPDGRALAWCEYGDPGGAPVFYFHGTPGSRIDPRFTVEEVRAAGVRLIACDRPGIGRSERVPGKRTFTGWASDVGDLADSLGIEQFAILAYSCGGPYALAAAAALPERVTRVGIANGVAPAEMPGYRKGLAPTDSAMTLLGRRAPWLARLLLARAIGTARKDPAKFAKEVDKDFQAAPDQEILDGGLREAFIELFLEAGRDGPHGVVEDFAVWARPSGIALDAIEAPVVLWHGEEDRTIPATHSRWVASKVRSAELTVLPGVGHLHTGERWREFFAALAY
jgi:pimeloyl-ACP methyl ester carboxylesterase